MPEFTKKRRIILKKRMPKHFKINPGTRVQQLYLFLKTGPKTWTEIKAMVEDIHQVPIGILIKNAKENLKEQQKFLRVSQGKVENLVSLGSQEKYLEEFPYTKDSTLTWESELSTTMEWVQTHTQNIQILEQFLKDQVITKDAEGLLTSSYWAYNAQLDLDKLRYFGYVKKITRGIYSITNLKNVTL